VTKCEVTKCEEGFQRIELLLNNLNFLEKSLDKKLDYNLFRKNESLNKK